MVAVAAIGAAMADNAAAVDRLDSSNFNFLKAVAAAAAFCFATTVSRFGRELLKTTTL